MEMGFVLKVGDLNECPTYNVTFLIVDNNETEILSGLVHGSHVDTITVVLLCWCVLSVANCGV
jgi:hypothetical protein